MAGGSNWNSSMALAVSTGVATTCAGVLMWKLSSKYDKLESSSGKDLCDVAKSLDVDAVGGLLSSPDAKVRKSAELFLINRASSKKNLVYFLRVCLSNDTNEVLKATTVVHMLAQNSDELKEKLVKNNAVNILRDVLEKQSNGFSYKYLIVKMKSDTRIERIFFCTMGSMFHLILRDPLTTLQFCDEELLIQNIFLPLIGDQGFHLSTDIKRWTLYLVHQLIMCSDTHPIKQSLLHLGLIGKVTECLIKTLGDILQTHLCLQIIIQYLTATSQKEVVRVCKKMISLGLTPHLVGLLRCEEDDNVIQLAAIIIHHFCCYELEIKYFVAIPSIVKILCTVLNNSNANIQKTIIRICNYLSVGSSQFQANLVEHDPIIKRLSICLCSGNADVVYGSLMLLHDLIMPGKEFAYQIIQKNPDILKALVKLSLTHNSDTIQLIPETLGFICSCESLHALILEYGVLEAILHFAKSSDVEVQFWASALLLNLSMISDEVKESMIRGGGIHILLEMAVSGDEVDLPDIATNATKTLVMMGFLEAKMDVKLASGLEGSIIIDGTEYCPGKQGINAVVFDFINYQFHKGRVIDTCELVDYFENPEFTISDSVFFVTQGDCSVSEETHEVMRKYLKKGNGNLRYPSWCWVYMPNDMQIQCSEDNILLNTKIEMKDLLGTVLEENFTDPLIDVILSMPPSSNINKLDELGLIEILSRHYHQRKAIVSTAGFLEYLFELIWSVVSLKHGYMEETNASKISHCTSALKIIHSCCNDKSSIKEMVHRGLLPPLVSLLQDLIVYYCNELKKSPSKRPAQQTASSNKDQSPKHESTYIVDEMVAKPFTDVIDEEPADNCDGSYLTECVANLSFSDDNIFQLEMDANISTSEANVLDIVFDASDETGNVNVSTPYTRPTTAPRNRTDSFILRNNPQTRNNLNTMQRSYSLADESMYDQGREEASTAHSPCVKSPSNKHGRGQGTPDHHQLRRISRSMSLSLQQAKYTEEYSTTQMKFSNDTLDKIGKYIVLIMYDLIVNSDDEVRQCLFESRVLPFLYGYIGCVSGSLHHERVWLAITSCLHNLASVGQASGSRKGVYMRHIDHPRSIIVRSDGLEISNENWYFESVIANQSISKQMYINKDTHPAGWYYEVTVYSDGVMQVGWANESCKFYPEKGCGVGDTVNSCGFDGARCKIWNGPSRDMVQENNFGVEWQKGDVLSVLLSWDGQLNFWLNGIDMGVSSCRIDTNIAWYPSLSLAISQHCCVAFKENSFKYKRPENYITIDEVYKNNHPTHAIICETDETIIRSIDDVFSEEVIDKPPTQDTFVLFYYEIDMLEVADDSEITIGVKVFHNIKPKLSFHPSNKAFVSDVKEVVHTIPAVVLDTNAEKKRLQTIGCGMLSNCCFIITLDGSVVFEKLLDDINIADSHVPIDVIPIISDPYILMNFGQKPFVYKHAASRNHMLLDHLCKLKDT